MIIHEDFEGSRALPAFTRAFADLIEEGLAKSQTLYHSKHEVIYEVDEPVGDVKRRVKGGFLFRVQDEVCWWTFAFTHADYQRQGVYTRVYAAFEAYLQEKNVKEINAFVHVTNTAMHLAAAKQKVLPEYSKISKRLRD